MQTDGQQLTKQSYEDPKIVEGYIQRNVTAHKQAPLIHEFVQSLTGKKVLDLGCGPGHDSYLLAELGYEVVGLDYSAEMIRRANLLKSVTVKPTFMVGDILQLNEYFDPNSFDAVWASASLLHIPREKINGVIQAITRIAKDGAKIYVGLKGGEGSQLVKENHLGTQTVTREFTFWTKNSFTELVTPYGWQLDKMYTREGRVMAGQATGWLQLFFTLHK